MATTDTTRDRSAGPDAPRPPGVDIEAGRRARRRRETLVAVALAAPAVLIVAGVYLYPSVATLVYSVTSIDIATYTIEEFVGLGNFATVVGGEVFQYVALRTLYFGVMVVALTIVPAFFIALLLNRAFPGRGLLRVVVLLPWAVPPVVAGVVWTQMFQPEFGFINTTLRTAGLPGDTIWLGDRNLALHALIVAEVWRWVPFATLFLLAGLQTVPRTTYEAAAIDGATHFQRLRYITVPLMAPITLPVMIFLFVWAMKAFDTIFVLTGGGPGRGTTTLNYLVYEQGFEQFRFGRAAATAYVLTLLSLLVIATLSLVRRRARARAGGL